MGIGILTEVGTPQHRLSSNAMALITSECRLRFRFAVSHTGSAIQLRRPPGAVAKSSFAALVSLSLHTLLPAFADAAHFGSLSAAAYSLAIGAPPAAAAADTLPLPLPLPLDALPFPFPLEALPAAPDLPLEAFASFLPLPLPLPLPFDLRQRRGCQQAEAARPMGRHHGGGGNIQHSYVHPIEKYY